MIVYLVKFILCSGLLRLAYRLLLSSERMYRFNRFYLLFSLLFSLTVPLLSITVDTNVLPVSYPHAIEKAVVHAEPSQSKNQQMVEVSSVNYLVLIAGFAYILITLALSARFARNLYRISQIVLHNNVADYHNTRLILIDDEVTPHSFLKYIFINKSDFLEGLIDPEIICHEQTHVRQWHSLDVLFVEILQTVCWFNPFIPVYKRDIQLNHEFLADESVIDNFRDKTAYQYLLLAKASQAMSLKLTSQFNYLTTKKRLIMITKSTSLKMAIFRQLAVMPLFGLFIFLFCQNVTAQSTPTTAVKQDSTVINRNTEQSPVEEFKTILAKYGTKIGRKGIRYQAANFSAEDKSKLISLYKQMSIEQQQGLSIRFLPIGPPMAKISPTEKQMKAWKDTTEYGVWVDDKKVKNSALSNYGPSDFDHYFVSRLTKAALHHNEYHYQIDLMTKAFYIKYYKEAKIQEGGYYTMTKMFPAPSIVK